MPTQTTSKNKINSNFIFNHLKLIQEKNPVVHNITNFVVMWLTANALLAVGASPIMAHALEEIEDILKFSKSLVINIGTLNNDWIDSMEKAAQTAQENNIPVVIDPVGAGATKFRANAVLKLLGLGKISVIRGNPAELMALAGITINSKGVDSQYLSDAALDAMQKLNEQYGSVVVASGAEDIIMQNSHSIKIQNGSAMMSKTTGMGCTASAIIGAFCSINSNYFEASACAMSIMGIAGEIASELSKGLGSFPIAFIDALGGLTQASIQRRLRLE